jgi:predicted AlkP superfamily pyrophosphatase or phosphodiesterase
MTISGFGRFWVVIAALIGGYTTFEVAMAKVPVKADVRCQATGLGSPAPSLPIKGEESDCVRLKTTSPKTPPKLLVAIAVDQFSADLFAQYRQHFTKGLARLMTGAVFPSAYQSHAATETCPGHSTILTGVHPARSGIIANNWYDEGAKRTDKKIYCAEDESKEGSSSKNPYVSAVHLRVPTLGMRMKAQWPESRNVAVSAKDRAVMMMGGQNVDAAVWWLYGKDGNPLNDRFVTQAGQGFSPAVKAENDAVGKLVQKGVQAMALPAWCSLRRRAVAAGPVAVGTGDFAITSGIFEQFRVSPRMDAATLDLAARLAAEMKLGKRGVPDMLSVSLSATDFIGHAYGNQGLEMCIQMNALDAALGVFFKALDTAGLDYAVVLTADHGASDLPERSVQQAMPDAARVEADLAPATLSKKLAAELQLPNVPQLVWAENPFGDYYISKTLAGADRTRVLAAVMAHFQQHRQVAVEWTHGELAAMPTPIGNAQDWTLAQRARASFDDARSGDVVMLLARGVVPLNLPKEAPVPPAAPAYLATHGSAWDYDRRVPLLFWRKGVAGMEQSGPVETVDIAPTLAALIGLQVEAGAFDGRCLDFDGGAGDVCKSGGK